MKRLAPILILLAAIGITVVLYLLRPEPQEVAPERPVTQVEVITVQPQAVRLKVESQGTLLPKIESELAVEVSGRIIEMSPDFRAGGRFKQGDVLCRIDASDYEAAVAARTAELATAELALAQEVALAEQAAADWAAIGEGAKEPSALTLRQPQLAQARANIASAEAALQQAERDLRRTEIKAPYDGRVLAKSVDLGQYVMANPANPVARIYATDTGEVRLPLAQREAEFISDPAESESKVTLSTDGPNGTRKWSARLVRFEGTVDPSSRLIYGVAEIDAPFEQGLRRGMFVTAEIQGRQLEDVYVLPRYALRGSTTIYVVRYSSPLRQALVPALNPLLEALTPIQKLFLNNFNQMADSVKTNPVGKFIQLVNRKTASTRTVEVEKSDDKIAIISDGLNPGDLVATSPIAYFVENMPVEIIANE